MARLDRTIQPRRVGKAKRAHHSLSERTTDILQVSAPIGDKNPTFDEAMKAAVRPVHDTGDSSMLHRIEVNVVDVTFEIGIIANSMLPIATLPDTFLALGNLTRRPWLRLDAA